MADGDTFMPALRKQACRLFLTGLFFAALAFFALTSAAVATEPVRIAIGQDFRPFEFVNERGEPDGLIADFWKLWSEKTGTLVQFKPAPWSETLEMMQVGEADIHAGLNRTVEREAFLDYADALLNTNSYVFSPAGMQLSGDLDQLTGFRIGVLKGSLEEAILEKRVPGVELLPYEAIDDLYDAIAENRVRLFADVEQTGLYFLKQRGLERAFRFDASRPLDSNALFAAVTKGDTALMDKVRVGLSQITPQERVDIIRRWLRPKQEAESDTLVIAIARNYPPFSTINANGQPVGMLVDIWRLWAEKTGHKIEFRQSSWADTLNNLGSGEVDIHSGLLRNDERDSWVEFSRPIYEITSSFYHRAGETLPDDLTGKSIGVIKGSNEQTYMLKAHPGARLISHEEREQLIRALIDGRLDGFLSQDRTIEDLLRQLGLGGRVAKTTRAVIKSEMMFGIRKGEAGLKAVIEAGLDTISHEEFAEIERRWVVFPESRYFNTNPLGLTTDERQWLADNPVIRVHNELDWPPFNFNEDGEAKGFSIDYMRAIADKLGLKVEFISGPSWNEFLGMMKADELDVMLNIVRTPDRLTYMDYTRPYVDNPNTILSRKDQPYSSLEELYGKTISVPKGFFYEEILKRDFPQINLHLVTDTLGTMKAVAFGQADAALGEFAVFNYLLDKHFMTDLVLSGEVKLGSPEYSLLNIATRKDTPLLATAIDKAVRSMRQESVRELKRKWLGEERSQTKTIPQIKLTDEEKAWLQDHPVILIGVDPDYPPFEFVTDDGAYAGIAAEYTKLASERLGIEFKLVPGLTWSQALSGVERKSVDVLPAAAKSPEREVYMNFTRPYLSHPTVIITRDDFPFVTGLKDLTDQVVAVVEGYSVAEKLKSLYPNLVYREYTTPLQALEAVATGKVAATVGNLAVDTYLIRQNNISNLKVAATADIDIPGLSFGVRKDWPELIGIMEKVLASVTPEEENAINERWVSVRFDVATDPKALMRVGLQVGGGAVVVILLIVGAIFVRNRRLEQEMRAREEAAQAKSDFVAVVSHEVRTPMNGVLGMARLILETPLSAKQKELARTIVDSGEALLSILNDLLDISKLEAGKLELEIIPFDPDEVIKNAVNIMAPKAKEKNLALSYEIDSDMPELLLGDGDRLRQILLNLLSNAMKFTDRGEIVVTLKGQRDEYGVFWLEMAVADSGLGISEDAAKNLFAPYVQAAGVARKYGGTGLGLSICRHLAELMGGSMHLQSRLGEGSTFSFEAPFEIAQIAEDQVFETLPLPSDGGDKTGLPGLRVLIVEDNLINSKVAKSLVENLGHHVTLAENGREALTCIEDGDPFDAILMDRHMPVMDGIEATRFIRQMADPVGSVPIIAVTAAVTQREIETCLEVGMNAVVSKPIDPDELTATLARFVTDNATLSGEAGALNLPGARAPVGEDLPPVLDKDVMSRLQNDFGDEVLTELIADFKTIGADCVRSFTLAGEENDVEPMTRFAHDLKTNAATLGLARLSEHARATELACKENRLDQARILGAQFPVLMDEAVQALEPGEVVISQDDGDEEALTLFLAKMAHDIRNNMNTVLGCARMLQDYSEDSDTLDDLAEYAKSIQSHSAHMEDMAADMLTLMQIEAGDFSPSPETLDAKQLAVSVARSLAPLARSRGVALNVDCAQPALKLDADRAALTTMLTHMMGNAVTDSAGDDTVSLQLNTSENTAVFTTTHPGSGLSEDDIVRVYGPYARIWQTDGQDGMAGLRYRIVERLAGLMGGRLEFGQGSDETAQVRLIIPNGVAP